MKHTQTPPQLPKSFDLSCVRAKVAKVRQSKRARAQARRRAQLEAAAAAQAAAEAARKASLRVWEQEEIRLAKNPPKKSNSSKHVEFNEKCIVCQIPGEYKNLLPDPVTGDVHFKDGPGPKDGLPEVPEGEGIPISSAPSTPTPSPGIDPNLSVSDKAESDSDEASDSDASDSSDSSVSSDSDSDASCSDASDSDDVGKPNSTSASENSGTSESDAESPQVDTAEKESNNGKASNSKKHDTAKVSTATNGKSTGKEQSEGINIKDDLDDDSDIGIDSSESAAKRLNPPRRARDGALEFIRKEALGNESDRVTTAKDKKRRRSCPDTLISTDNESIEKDSNEKDSQIPKSKRKRRRRSASPLKSQETKNEKKINGSAMEKKLNSLLTLKNVNGQEGTKKSNGLVKEKKMNGKLSGANGKPANGKSDGRKSKTDEDLDAVFSGLAGSKRKREAKKIESSPKAIKTKSDSSPGKGVVSPRPPRYTKDGLRIYTEEEIAADQPKRREGELNGPCPFDCSCCY